MDPYYEQRLRDEVIYLHSLWHQGPPRPAPAAVPLLRPANPTQLKKKKKKKPRADIGRKSTNSAAETNASGGAERPRPPAPLRPSTTGGPSPAPKPQSQPNSSGASPQLRPKPTQFKKKKKKKPRDEIGQKSTNSAAETNASGGAEPSQPPPSTTGGLCPAPIPQSLPNSSGAPLQLRPVKPTQIKKKKKLRAEIEQKSTNSAAETNSSGGAERPRPPSRPPPSTTGSPSPAPKPQSQPNSSGASPQLRPVKPTQFKKKKKKIPRAEIGQKSTNSAAETNSSGGAEWPCPPSPPPPSTTGWPSPAPKPQSQPNLLSVEDQSKLDSRNAHRSALRVVCEFIANNYADDSDDIGSSSDEDDEFMGEDNEFSFFFKVFEDDTELREFYEKNFARGEFSCLVCSAIGGKKSSKKFKGCLPLVQHSITIAKTKKRRAHRAFGQAICKVLGWNIDNLGPVVSMVDAMGAGSSDIKQSSMTLVSNVVSEKNGDLEGKDEEAVPESVDVRCEIAVNGDEGNVVTAAIDGAGNSDNMESSVTLVSNVVSVNNDDLEDKNGAVPDNVEIQCRIALNGDEGDVNPVTCCDAGINSEDDSMVHTNNVEKPASDGLTSIITHPDAGINLEDGSKVLIDNAEKLASDGLTSTITCPDAGMNLEDDSMVLTGNPEKPASDGLTSTITHPDAGINLEDGSMECTDNVEKPASDGLTSNSLTSTDADKNSENLCVVQPLNMEDTAPELQPNVPLNNDAGDEVQDLKTG